MEPQIGNSPAESGLSEEKILDDLLEASNIKRYHTFPIIGEQTVGAHTHRVLILLDYLAEGIPAYLYRAVLYHDSAELATGDIPATTKWSEPALSHSLKKIEEQWERDHCIVPSTSLNEHRLLKTADMLELVMFSRDQWMLGNRNALGLIQNGIMYLRSLYPEGLPKKVDNLIRRIEDDCK